jgi:transcriptional regulator with XRE-family HTH domain
MTIGNRVIELLNQKKIRQKDLAEHLGTSPSTINGWRLKNRNPSSDMVIPICDFLGVTPEYLLTGEEKSNDKSNYLSAEDREWISMIHDLPPEVRAEIKGEMKGYLKRMKEESSGGDLREAAGK